MSDETQKLRAENEQLRAEIKGLRAERERLRGELDTMREQLTAAVTLLAEWCHAIDGGGASWDEWDDHYKKAKWGLHILRSLIDVEIAKLKENGR